MAEKEPTARVTMLWPVDLKEKVRSEVGGRGLTDFTIEAVTAKLGTHDTYKANAKELNEVKFLAQQLADAIAMGADYEDRYGILQRIGLPDWIETAGWPPAMAALVKPEDSTPEPVRPEPEPEPDPGEDEDLHRPMFMVGRDEPGGVGSNIVRDLPHDIRVKDDLFERIQAKAAEKGVDLSGVDLKSASEVEPPGKLSQEEMLERVAKIEPADSEMVRLPARCSNCGSEMVGNECWECM